MFQNYPHIAYKLPDGERKILKDMMVRVYYRGGFDDEKATYNFYDVLDGERPEDVSFKAYGSQDYHWVILLFNEMLDPYYDWYMSQSNLLKYVKGKYDDMNAIKHYVDNEGYINSVGIGVAVTNFDYEYELNEKRRRIKILSPIYLKKFIDEHSRVVYSS